MRTYAGKWIRYAVEAKTIDRNNKHLRLSEEIISC